MIRSTEMRRARRLWFGLAPQTAGAESCSKGVQQHGAKHAKDTQYDQQKQQPKEFLGINPQSAGAQLGRHSRVQPEQFLDHHRS